MDLVEVLKMKRSKPDVFERFYAGWLTQFKLGKNLWAIKFPATVFYSFEYFAVHNNRHLWKE